MKYDINKDYYAILGLDSTASKEEINEAIDNYINVITKSDSINFAKDATTTIVEVMNVLKNPEVKKEYDLAKGFITEKAIEEKDNDINDDNEYQVSEIEDDDKSLETAETAKEKIARYSIAGLAVAICVVAGSAFGAYSSRKNNKTAREETIASVINQVNTSTESTTPVSESSTIAATTSESTTAENDQDAYNTIWNEIQTAKNSDNNFAKDISENDIKSLVDWAKQNENHISNKDAFGLLFELANNKNVDIADITNGLDISESMHKYTEAFKNVNDNQDLNDETDCLNQIKNMESTIDKDNVVEANIITAEMYAHVSNSPEFSVATGDIEQNGQEAKDSNYMKMYNSISKEQMESNYNTYTQFINSLNNALDKSDAEDKNSLSR
jgi:hypothetical protein